MRDVSHQTAAVRWVVLLAALAVGLVGTHKTMAATAAPAAAELAPMGIPKISRGTR